MDQKKELDRWQRVPWRTLNCEKWRINKEKKGQKEPKLKKLSNEGTCETLKSLEERKKEIVL